MMKTMMLLLMMMMMMKDYVNLEKKLRKRGRGAECGLCTYVLFEFDSLRISKILSNSRLFFLFCGAGGARGEKTKRNTSSV